jgi:glycosyltransferase involved in cell wall biosynthesis
MSVSVSLKATESPEIANVGKFPANQSAVHSAKMKIAHVNDCLDMGGSEKLTTILCRLQRALGHSASVHCLYSIGVLGRELQVEGMDVVLHGPSSPIRLMRSLYRSFKSRTPDVVHCHNSTATVLGALPARLAGVKTIVATRHSLVQPPYQLQSELRFAVASRWCDWIVGVCESTQRNLAAAPLAARGKIVHIYNGASAANPDAVPRAKSGYTLLHVGRLVPEKDQATLLHAVAIARPHIPDVHLWIIGDGPLGTDLRKLSSDLGLNDRVTFFGAQNDISQFLVAADLFVMSSKTEGLPLALLEAMSVGLPAVITDVGGMSEIALLSHAAVRVPTSDPEALAIALCDAAANRDEPSEAGKSALHCYQQYFTPELMVNNYLRLYNSPSAHS